MLDHNLKNATNLYNIISNIMNDEIEYSSLYMKNCPIIPYFSNDIIEKEGVPSIITDIKNKFQQADFYIFLISGDRKFIDSKLLSIFEWLEHGYSQNICSSKYNIILSFSQNKSELENNLFKSISLSLMLDYLACSNIKGYLSIVNSNKNPNDLNKIVINANDHKKIKSRIVEVLFLSRFKN